MNDFISKFENFLNFLFLEFLSVFDLGGCISDLVFLFDWVSREIF